MLQIVNEIIDIIRNNAVQTGEEEWGVHKSALPQIEELWEQLAEEDLEIAYWMITQRLPGFRP